MQPVLLLTSLSTCPLLTATLTPGSSSLCCGVVSPHSLLARQLSNTVALGHVLAQPGGKGDLPVDEPYTIKQPEEFAVAVPIYPVLLREGPTHDVALCDIVPCGEVYVLAVSDVLKALRTTSQQPDLHLYQLVLLLLLLSGRVRVASIQTWHP